MKASITTQCCASACRRHLRQTPKVYTTLADFSNPDAKSAMAEYLAADAALRRLTSSLDGLRWKYAAGDRSVGHDIIEGEAEQVRLRKRMQTLRNSAVRMETKTR